MGGQATAPMGKRERCVGLLAHVDAGKTTLSEAMLYESGTIRRLGRVDHGDAFLDTDALERERGITIFSKQARLSLPEEVESVVREGGGRTVRFLINHNDHPVEALGERLEAFGVKVLPL